MKNQKIANINIDLKKLFTIWLEITSSFHKLTKQEKKSLSLFLYHHYKLQQDITNENIVWEVLFDYDTKHKIIKELGVKNQSFYNVMTSLRKKKVIVDNKISNIYIPNISKDSSNFKIIFNFNIIKDEKK